MKIAKKILWHWLIAISLVVCPLAKADTFALNIYKEDGNGCNMSSNDFLTTAMKKGWLFAGYLFQYMIDDNYKMNYSVGIERSKSEEQLSVYASNIKSDSETRYRGQDELFGVSECDISVCYLSNIFGKMPGLLGTTEGINCPSTVGSIGPEIVKAMFSYFNVGMMSVLYVFIAFYIFNGVLVGGYEGSITEKQLSLIAATRMCISAICMIPTSSGYTYLQIIIMYVLLNGVGFADRAFSNALYVFDQQLNQQLMGLNSAQINKSAGVVTDSQGNVVSDSDKQFAAYKEYYNSSFLDALRIYSCSYYKDMAAKIPKSGNFDMPAQPYALSPDPQCGSVAISDPATLNMLRNVSYSMLYSAYTYYFQKAVGLSAISGGSQENKTATSLDAYGTCLMCKNVQGFTDQYYVAAGQLQATTSQLGGATDIAKCNADAATNYNGMLPKRENYIGDKLNDSSMTNENSVIDNAIEYIPWSFCRTNNPGKAADKTYSGCLLNLANYINTQVESNNLVSYNSTSGDYQAPISFNTSNTKDNNSGSQISITNDCNPNYFDGYTDNALRSRLALIESYRTLVREQFKSASYSSKVYELLQDYNTPIDDTPTSSSSTTTTTNSQGASTEEVVKVSNIDNVINRVVEPFYASKDNHPFFNKVDRGFYSTGAILNPAYMNLQTTVLMIAKGMLGIELIDHKSYANYPESHSCMWNIYANYCKNNSGRCYTELKNNNCIMQGRGLIGAYDAIKSNVTYNPFKDFVSLGMTIMQATGLYLVTTNIQIFQSTVIISVQKHAAVIPVTIAGKVVQDMLKHGLAKKLMLPPALSQIANQTAGVATQVINLLADFDYAIMENFTTIGSAFALLTFPMGMMMAILIPFYPVMIYTVAALGYFVSVVEVMVGAPILALGLAYPQGHDIFGRSTTGFLNIFAVFLKPILMVISVIVSMQLMVVALTLINYGYINQLDVVLRNLYSGSGEVMVFIIWGFIFVYMYAVWELVSKSCSLMASIGNKALSYIAPSTADDSGQKAMGVMSSVKGGVQGAGSKLSSSMGSLTGSATQGIARKLDSQFTQGFKSGFKQVTTPAHLRAKNTALAYYSAAREIQQSIKETYSKTIGQQNVEALKNMSPAERQKFLKAESDKNKALDNKAKSLLDKIIASKKGQKLDFETAKGKHERGELNAENLELLRKELNEQDGADWAANSDNALLFKKMGLTNEDIRDILILQQEKSSQTTAQTTSTATSQDRQQQLQNLSKDANAVNLLHKAYQIPDNQYRFSTYVNLIAHSPNLGETRETFTLLKYKKGGKEEMAKDVFALEYKDQFASRDQLAKDIAEVKNFAEGVYNDENRLRSAGQFGVNFMANSAKLLGMPILSIITGDDSYIEADRQAEITQFRNDVFRDADVIKNMSQFNDQFYTDNMSEEAKAQVKENNLKHLLESQQVAMTAPTDTFIRAFDYQSLEKSGFSMEEIARVNDSLGDNKIRPEDMISLRGPTVDELVKLPEMTLNRQQIIDALIAEKVSSAGSLFGGATAHIGMLNRFDRSDLRKLGIKDDEINDARERRISGARGLFNRTPEDPGGRGSAGEEPL